MRMGKEEKAMRDKEEREDRFVEPPPPRPRPSAKAEIPPGAKGVASAPKGILVKLAEAMGMDLSDRRADPKEAVRRVIERHIRRSSGTYTDEKVHSLLIEVGYRDKGEGQGH